MPHPSTRPPKLLNRAYEGPCREPPCPRRNASSHGYCYQHTIGRIYNGRRPGSRLSSSALPFHGPCRIFGCPRRTTGPHGMCHVHRDSWKRGVDVGVVDEMNRYQQALERGMTPAVLARLPQREAEILQQRLGQKLTLEEIGQRHGFTRERARQLVNRAMGHLADLTLNLHKA